MPRFLVLGGTGPVGIAVIRRAIPMYPSSTIVVYVRSPEKLPPDIINHPHVTIVEGQLHDRNALHAAMEGVDVVISALGPSVKKGPFHPADTPLAKGYAVVIEVMKERNVPRLICLGTASITDPNDKHNVAFSLLVAGVATFAKNAYKDMVAIGETVRTEGAELEWTIVRVPVLTDKDNSAFFAGYVGDGKTSTFLSRKGFAAFVLEEVSKREWVRMAPLISTK
ncbi:NAD-P-binding protein [Pluteus cervinus]|uniref:NAD-P-binding protein n=1 Tax=Pluteus cervinus TaxID=181527 RepID=A0ACD3BG56_9AGAR|nr:NAD-P-binding protein [Pluteus cervinus]